MAHNRSVEQNKGSQGEFEVAFAASQRTRQLFMAITAVLALLGMIVYVVSMDEMIIPGDPQGIEVDEKEVPASPAIPQSAVDSPVDSAP
ncbi:hypothetical protein SH668x_001654 [Planctomicrobium sp. SH668]|uniref:hypothetical protein n=1 Tax=Planctomicrobium sp. SH668 TaxID=3448126 RepID=UPI003F5C5095